MHAGELVETWGSQGYAREQFYYPTRITVGPEQRVWVTDAYNHHFKVYAPDSELIHIIGGKGDKPGEFNVPGGVAFDAAGGVWVADFFNNRIQHFADASDDSPRVTIWTGEGRGVGPGHRGVRCAVQQLQPWQGQRSPGGSGSRQRAAALGERGGEAGRREQVVAVALDEGLAQRRDHISDVVMTTMS